jgi:hypothetical protein
MNQRVTGYSHPDGEHLEDVMMKRLKSLRNRSRHGVMFALVGAGASYLFDPQNGADRRASLVRSVQGRRVGVRSTPAKQEPGRASSTTFADAAES